MSSAQPERPSDDPDFERRRRATSFSITAEDDRLIDALANALNVSRSLAISHLVAVHAGKEIERVRQDATPYPVVRWASPKIGEALIGYLAGLVRAGNLIEVAASMAGITPRQLGDWRRRGRRDLKQGTQTLYADFVANLDAAEAEAKVEDIQRIRQAGQRDWRALAWHLARSYPDEYGERKRVDHTARVNLTPVIDWERLNVTQTRALLELLRLASPELDDPRLSKQARPALELLPPDLLEQLAEAPAIETLEGEAREAPGLEDDSEKPQP